MYLLLAREGAMGTVCTATCECTEGYVKCISTFITLCIDVSVCMAFTIVLIMLESFGVLVFHFEKKTVCFT